MLFWHIFSTLCILFHHLSRHLLYSLSWKFDVGLLSKCIYSVTGSNNQFYCSCKYYNFKTVQHDWATTASPKTGPRRRWRHGSWSKLPCKCDVHGLHSELNTEPFSSHGVCPAFGFILPAKYSTHLLQCTHATKETSWFGGFGQYCLSLLSTYWVLSAYFLANRCIRLLTRAYGTTVNNILLASMLRYLNIGLSFIFI